MYVMYVMYVIYAMYVMYAMYAMYVCTCVCIVVCAHTCGCCVTINRHMLPRMNSISIYYYGTTFKFQNKQKFGVQKQSEQKKKEEKNSKKIFALK